MSVFRVLFLGLLVAVSVAPAVAVQTSEGAKTIWSGVFSEQQATRGQQIYKQSCAMCHKDDLLGEAGTPALAGADFLNRFNGSSVDDLVQITRASMPQDAPDSLGTPAYVDLITFVLKTNGVPAGSSDLPTERAALKQIRVTLSAK